MLKIIKHHFIGGVYAKEMLIPEDFRVVSHKHTYDHMSVLTVGCVIVEADGEQETYWAPAIIEIKAGVEHSVLAVNGDAHWLCIHATDCTDQDKVDEVLIQKPEPVQHMRKLPFRIDTNKLKKELAWCPELWDKYQLRTHQYEDSPHREVSDIWVRYRDFNEFDPENPNSFSEEHKSIWYNAYYQLPSIEWIIAQLVDELGKFELGGVLITKVPPGKQVYPHSDAGHWHSEYYDTKALVLIDSAPGQRFWFENGEVHEGEAGDVFLFDNRPVHWVTNGSDNDRISLLLAIKRKP